MAFERLTIQASRTSLEQLVFNNVQTINKFSIFVIVVLLLTLNEGISYNSLRYKKTRGHLD